MSNAFDQFDEPASTGNAFDQFDAPANPKSYLRASAESGVRNVVSASARILDALNPFTTSDEEAAALYKTDPEGLKRFQEKSAGGVLSRVAREQSTAADETMKQVSPTETGAISGKPLSELEYATLDPNKAAYLSPTRVAGDVLGSLPSSIALGAAAYFTRGRAIAAGRDAFRTATTAGATEAEAAAAAHAAATKAGAEAMAKSSAVGEGAVGAGQQYDQALQEAMKVPRTTFEAAPEYKRLVSEGYDPEVARVILANQVARNAGSAAGVADAVTNLVGGRVLGKVIGEGGKLLPRTAKGFASESATETVQSAGEQLGQNVAMRDIDPSQDRGKGVGEAAAAGAVVGGVMGGGTAGAFGRPHPTPQQQAEKVFAAPDVDTAIAAANELAQANVSLDAAIAGYLAPTSSPNEQIAPDVSIPGVPGVQVDEQTRRGIDRQAELTGQANAAGTAFERQNALEQAQAALAVPQEQGPAASFADLTPMTPLQARQRLVVLRDQLAQEGGNALELSIAQHPSQQGALAIARTPLPSLELGVSPIAEKPVSPETAQARIEAAALAGSDAARKNTGEEQGRQALLTRVLKAIEDRGGVASPEEARVVQEANVGQPYDRIDESLSPPLSEAERLTQATGLSVGRRPREEVQTGAKKASIDAENTELARDATAAQERANANAFDQFDAGRPQRQQAAKVGQQVLEDRANQAPQRPRARRVIDVLKTPAFQRDGAARAILQLAQARYSADEMAALQAQASAPATMTQEQRLVVQRLRNDTRASTPRTAQLLEAQELVEVDARDLPSKSSAGREPGTRGITKETHGLLTRLAKVYGKKVVIYEGSDNRDGFYSRHDPDTVYLNRNSSKPHLVVFGHELLHSLKTSSPGAYAALEAAVKAQLKDGALDEFAKSYGENADTEELVADLVGNRMGDEAFWAGVFSEMDAPAVAKLGAAIIRAVNAAKKVLADATGFKTDVLVKDLDAVKVAVQQAMRTFAQERRTEAAKGLSTKPTNVTNANSAAGRASAGGTGENVQNSGIANQEKEQPRAEDGKFKSWSEADELAQAEAQMRASPAYHGTHARDIEKFDTSKIGTGEGSQAFGWGLYFAGNEKVAEFYRKWTAGEAGGQVYKVEVPDETNLLDREAKIADQPQVVKDALKQLGVVTELVQVNNRTTGETREFADMAAAKRAIVRENINGVPKTISNPMTGAEVYSLLSSRLGGDRAASLALDAAGVPGLMYGDAYSRRGVTEGKMRNYVIFNGENVKKVAELRASARRQDIPEYGTPRPGAISVLGVHYSKQPRERLSSSAAGTGLRGADNERVARDGGEKRRIYFYVEKGKGVLPEAGVGGYAHQVLLSNLYDAEVDPLSLAEDNPNPTKFEAAVTKAGFDGYYRDSFRTDVGAAVLLGDHQVPVKQTGQGPQKATDSTPARATPTEKTGWRKTLADFNASKRLPTGSPAGARWAVLVKQLEPDLFAAMEPSGVFDTVADRSSVYKSELAAEYRKAADTRASTRRFPSDLDKELMTSVPLMRAANRLEFQQRLQWLSEGMLRNNIEAVANYKIDQAEVEQYQRYKDSRDGVRASVRREDFPGLAKIEKGLTKAEREKLNRGTAQRLTDLFKELPATDEFAAAAWAGKAKRGWYRESAQAIAQIFGVDAPRFAALLAAMSPQVSVQSNLVNALNTWKNWQLAGRPTDRESILDVMAVSVQGGKGRGSVLDAWINNSVRALGNPIPEETQLSGPKVDSFMRNLLGNVEEVTNDAWMANFALVDQTMFSGKLTKTDSGKGVGYLAMNAKVRLAAKRITDLTGDEWTPSEVQETIWSWAKTLYEAQVEGATARDILYNEELTDDMIRSTPDFKGLFHDDKYATILRDAGYGSQLDNLKPGVAGAASAEGAAGQAEPFDSGTQARLVDRAAARLEALKERGEVEPRASARRAEDPYTGDKRGQDLAGLPDAIDVPGRGPTQFHAFKPAQDIAAQYMQDRGLPYAPPATYAKVDKARAARIADLYDAAVHQPNDPETKAAYAAMAAETKAQYRALMRTGLKVEFIPNDGPDPYATSPRLAILDVVENNHLWVFSTRDGFGSSEFDPANNPLLADSGLKISGQPALMNDLFRVVHDYFGHIKDGIGFRADGEENAWRSHSAMYSPLARRAMTSETRGQNSWVNFGPAAEANKTASGAETTYADQKTTLLPEWVSEEGRTDAPAAGALVNIGLAVPGGGSITADEAVQALERNGGTVVSRDEHVSDTEPTLVAGLAKPLTAAQAEAVSRELKQESIAQKVGDTGELYGPMADQWRPFNPEFFLMPDGTRASNPDIRASGWRVDAPTKMDDFIRAMQDKHVDTKRIVAAVKQQIGDLGEKWNPYLQEELYHGRTAKRTKDFLDFELRPLLVEMQARGVTVDQLETFLHNRHAEERNDQIAKINDKMPDGGSGIKTADARAYLAALKPAERVVLDALAKRVDSINTNTEKTLVSSGLEKQDTIDAWKRAYKNYVPLQREEFEEDTAGGTGQGMSTRGAAVKRAMGSDKPVANILANIAAARERTIVRAEKNRVATAVYGMSIKAPNKDFWMAFAPDRMAKTAQIQAELVGLGMTPPDAANVMSEPQQRYVDPRSGRVVVRANPLLRSAPNILALRVNGEDRFVVFSTKDERAERAVRQLKNLDADQLGRVMSTLGKISRWFASVNTQWNPIFGIVNILRDTQEAVVNLSTTPIADRKTEVLKGTGSALLGIYADVRAHRKGRVPQSPWAQLWEEFQKEGGQTGYRDMYANPKERAESVQKEFAKITEGSAKAAGRAVFDWLSDYNEAMENAVRLSAYRAAKDKGLSNQLSASIAKNLTVNFNRKGDIALQAGALYAFFNASVQGSARLAETLRGPMGKRIVAGGLLLGVMQAFLLSAAGFGEDDPPEFLKDNNLVLPLKWARELAGLEAGKDYLTIPLPLGLKVLPSTARRMTEWMMSGGRNTSKALVGLLGVFADAFNPIGNAGISLQTLAPTAFDPLAALAENKDFAGRPIAREDFNGMKPTPGHTRARDTSSGVGRAASWFINKLSGGTEYTPGAFSPTPDQIDYLLGQVTGGLGREVLKTSATVHATSTGEDLPPYKVPLLGRFYGDTTGQASVAAKYYANVKKLNLHKEEMDGRRKNGEGASLQEYIRENPEAVLAGAADHVQRRLADLKKVKKRLVDRGADPEQIKAIEANITKVMSGLNERIEKRINPGAADAEE